MSGIDYLPWNSDAERADLPCIRDDNEELTYAEFSTRVDRFASCLLADGITAGDVIAVMLPNRVELLIAIMAAWRIGAAATPVNPTFTYTEAGYQIDDARAAITIVEDGASPIEGKVIRSIDDITSRTVGLVDVEPVGPAPEDLALLIYTSGSTGRPKGVELTHSNLQYMAGAMATHFGLTSDDHSLLILPLFHVNAICVSVLAPLSVGGQVSITGRFSPSRFFDDVARLRPTYFSAVPTIYALLTAQADDIVSDTSSLRFAVCGAAPISKELLDRAETRFGYTIVEGYGLTEGTCASACNPPNGIRKLGTVGPALPGQSIAIADEHGTLLPVGGVGEVLICGPNVMRGYLDRPDESSGTVVDGWLHTGDVGRLDEDGYLTLVDRIKDMIIRGGENIYPKEIENALATHSEILEAAVVGAADDVYGEVPVAYVVTYPNSDVTSTDLLDHLRARLTKVKLPVAIHVVDALPRNPVGKIDKPGLRRTPSATPVAELHSPYDTRHSWSGLPDEVIVAAQILSRTGALMGFKEGNFPQVDPATFLDLPFRERLRAMSTHWADHGFGTPKMVHTIYLLKLLVLYIGAGVAVATLTSGHNPLDISAWWNEPIVYQKLLLWTLLLETVGLGGSWGPLAGHFKPMMGGALFWLRPGTIRLPPWPGKVPLTTGDSRTVFDVVVYDAVLVNIVVALTLPGVHTSSIDSALADNNGLVRPALMMSLAALLVVIGLRDKVIFIAARGEQYFPALLFFAFLPFIDMIIALKLLIVTVWVCAGISKLGHHFSMVIPPMLSNTPWIPSKALKRAHYRNFPHDLRPSRVAGGVGHVLGTLVEVATPLVLLFTTNAVVALAGVGLMVAFHLFITSTFPLAVPLEWNLLFAFAAVFLFLGFPNADGYAVWDFSSLALLALIVAGLVFFPILGNLRPDLVSFLPSMRQYAGNWASATWAFAPGCEDKLDQFIERPSQNTRTQLLASYPPEVADVVMHQLLGWRSLHSQGRALFSLMMNHLGDDIDTYTLREGEFSCNSIVAFNFGDGHLHDDKLIAAIQRRCNFAPGEFLAVWIESQPIHKNYQEYQVIDAALGVIERGTYKVADAINEQPWLPNGPIPVDVTWTLDIDANRAATDPGTVEEPKMRDTTATESGDSVVAPTSQRGHRV